MKAAVRIHAVGDIEPLILGQDLHQTIARGNLSGRERKQRNDAFAHVTGRFELAEAFVRGEPTLGHKADDDAAGARRVAQGLCPFFAADDTCVIYENISEAAPFQGHASRPRAAGSSLLAWLTKTGEIIAKTFLERARAEQHRDKPNARLVDDLLDRAARVLRNMLPYKRARLTATKLSGDRDAPLFDLSGLSDQELLFLRRTVLKVQQVDELQ
jgi:hypothetical protein